ncbi:membrane steroid-binding protein 2-like [Juglans regia]|uniref:Membrane steroid-binding protein 2-like n=1 Tax=Juglans regia TaxID=51240 RepID=A0A6P9ETS6_JUGRE|nr:membrane steroid-binding protein 2-like [Juglans regia]
MFYGPSGPYAFFAGKEASRALTKMSFEVKDLTGDISFLGPFKCKALQDWEFKTGKSINFLHVCYKHPGWADAATEDATATGMTTRRGCLGYGETSKLVPLRPWLMKQQRRNCNSDFQEKKKLYRFHLMPCGTKFRNGCSMRLPPA